MGVGRMSHPGFKLLQTKRSTTKESTPCMPDVSQQALSRRVARFAVHPPCPLNLR